MFSELQKHDKRKSLTHNRVLAEGHHWAGELSKCRDKYEHALIERDIAATQSMASKDAVIEKLQRDLQLLTQSLKDQKEDTECLLFGHRQSLRDLRKDQKEDTDCLLFGHWQSLRDLRSTMGRTIDSKQDDIKRLGARIVDQGEMCYEMLDEARALGGSRQDIGVEGAVPVLMNLKYYVEFLTGD